MSEASEPRQQELLFGRANLISMLGMRHAPREDGQGLAKVGR
jgi:hypothetical protein